jgi:hypothetical protein
MKKSILKTKLVLHTETIKALTGKDLVRVAGAGQEANNNDGATHLIGTCPAAAVVPGPA